MKLIITSKRGHHEAVLEPEVSKLLFDKMTGKMERSLDKDLKQQIPDTFEELKGLWKRGNPGYTAYDENEEIMTEFNPEAKEVLFVAPIAGG